MHPGLRYIAAAIGWHLLALVFLVPQTFAQETGSLDSVYADAGLDQRLGELVPRDLVFTDEAGNDVTLSKFINGEKPVVLTLVYHTCPMLCNVLLDGVTTGMAEMEWTAGQEFEMITLSIAPEDTPQIASEKKALYLEKLNKQEAAAGWHFLTGTEASIDQLADAIGFRYGFVEEIGQYVHPPIVTILTPEGKISRYLQGLTYKARDIRLALVEASDGKIGSPIDFITLFCLQYDPETNAYVAHAANLMRLGGILTVFVLGAALFVLWRKETHRTTAAQ